MSKKSGKKTFIVIGCGRFGSYIVKELTNAGREVLAIDINEDNVKAISKYTTNCLVADGTKLSVLQEIGAAQIDHAVVTIGNNLQASILTVLNLKNLGIKRITVRADEEMHGKIYTQLGADEVIIPEEASAINLANQMLSDTILDYYPLSNDYSIVKIKVGEEFIAQSIIDLNVRVKFDVNIVAMVKNGVFQIPKPKDLIEPNDLLVIVATKENYGKFDAFLNSKKSTKKS